VFKWHRQKKAPQARAAEPEFQSHEAREATELYVHRLLAPLPPKDREIISFAWGVEGVEKATPQKLAELGECSVSTVYKRLGKLYVEIAARQSQ
jgi:DNA-directed RNA polymerase specialized sigma24 family protein